LSTTLSTYNDHSFISGAEQRRVFSYADGLPL
jgi:hypothetical protein